MFLDHTQWHITVGRTSLDEWSARRRDLYLPTHNTHKRRTDKNPYPFELAITASEWPYNRGHWDRCTCISLRDSAVKTNTMHYAMKNKFMLHVSATPGLRYGGVTYSLLCLFYAGSGMKHCCIMLLRYKNEVHWKQKICEILKRYNTRVRHPVSSELCAAGNVLRTVPVNVTGFLFNRPHFAQLLITDAYLCDTGIREMQITAMSGSNGKPSRHAWCMRKDIRGLLPLVTRGY